MKIATDDYDYLTCRMLHALIEDGQAGDWTVWVTTYDGDRYTGTVEDVDITPMTDWTLTLAARPPEQGYEPFEDCLTIPMDEIAEVGL